MFKYVKVMSNQYKQLFPLYLLLRHALPPISVEIVL